MSKRALDEFVDKGGELGDLDVRVSKRLIGLANRTSRRSFLGLVGRGSIALMGASFFQVWRAESARAACGGSHAFTQRLTCMCTELRGENQCGSANCCSGYWIACPKSTSNPAACYITDPAGTHFYNVKLYDCCDTCGGNCNTSKAGCSSYGNDSCCSHGYCSDGCGGDNWKVKCIKKECIYSAPC